MSEFFKVIAQDAQDFFKTISYGSLNELIVCFAIGAVIAALYALYSRVICGEIVRYLLEENADTPETAKTLLDAKLDKSRAVRHALRKNSNMRRIVTILDAPPEEKGKKSDIRKARLYIEPGKNQAKASHMYTVHGNGIGAVLLTIVVCTVLAAVCIIYIPEVVQLLKNAKDTFF